jgi:O-antigen ligase
MTFHLPRPLAARHRHSAPHHHGDGHHGHRHSHHAHGHNRSGAVFAVFACLLVGWSVIPLASVGFFETRLLAMGTWILVAAAALFPRRRSPLPDAAAWTALACTLLLWCTLQLVPLPAARFPFWRGDAEMFARIASHAGGRLCMALVPYHSFHTLIHWSGLFALGCMAARCLRSRTSLRWLFAGFVLVAATECAYGLFLRNPDSLRLRGTFANSDAFGSLLAMCLPLTAALLLDRIPSAGSGLRRLPLAKQGWLLSLAALFLLQLVVLFFTGSRGATASAFAALAILLGCCWRKYRAGRKALLGGLLLLAVLAPLFFVHAQRQNVWDRAFNDNFEWQSGIEGRKYIWKAGLDLVRAFPCGTGPGGTAFAMPIYQTAVHGRYRLDYAHNDTLQFLGDLGWPGGVLLLAGLLLLARRAVRACRTPDDGTTPWLQRGAALALLAALVHSQAEFNLSARPPLQLMFAILAGVLFAPAGTSRHHRNHGGEAPSSFRLLRLPVVLAATAAVFFSFRAAVAYRGARAAARALEIATPATDSPLLLPTARTLPIPPDDTSLARAGRLGARSPFVQSVLASIPLSNHRHAVRQTALLHAKAMVRREETDEDAPPPEPEVTPALLASVGAVLRLEEAEAVRAARPFADAALRLAPWDAMIMADRAWLVLRGVVLRVAPESEAAAARADLELAAALYPTDAYTLSAVCAALSAEEKTAENLPEILSLAERAFSLNPLDAMMLMDRWWRAGIPLSSLARIPGLPVPVLQKLYRRALDASDTSDLAAGDAAFILARIEERTAPDAPPPDAAEFWTPKRFRAWERQRDRQRLWAVTERLRRNLRSGDWAAVAASAPDRAGARDLRFRLETGTLENSPVLRRLRLREKNTRHSLPRSGRLEWAIAECAASSPPEEFREVWEEALRHRPLPADQANRLPAAVRTAYPALLLPPAPGEPAESPDGLALPYLGERLFLDDIFIEPDASAPGGARLLLDWCFAEPPFPPGLRILVRLRDESGRLLANKSFSLEKAMPAFRRGNPPPGTRFRAALPLPLLAASYARTLEILPFDRKTSLPQDDLQGPLRIPYPSIPVRAPAEDGPEADPAAEDARNP